MKKPSPEIARSVVGARLLERALQRDLLARQRQHAAGVVGGVRVLRVDERAEKSTPERL